ncbi:MAG: FAD-dependent oxidoreductase [Clostridia bacterium]|nr:FAD-dependent oxidoreductase [Clostridia bacterium]
MDRITYQKELPLYGSYDVVVLGGGPAGVCAAVAAARMGAKTLLVESYSTLGGMATGALVGPLMTVYDRDGEKLTVGGLFREIVDRLKAYGAVIEPEEVENSSVYTSFIEKYHRHVTPFSPYYLEIVLDEMVREAGVELLCYTRFTDCIMDGERIRAVMLSALEGPIAVTAKTYIDCTGTAAVAEKAGVPTYKGDEVSGVPQPGTLMFELGGVDDAAYKGYGQRPTRPVKAYRTPEKGRYTVNHYHVYNVDQANSKSLTDAHSKARYQVLDAHRLLKTETPGFAESKLLQVASVLGVRESRHIEGEYKITVEDVSNGTKFDDRIAVYGFGMDVHGRSEAEKGNFKIEIAERYYIPYRSLIPKKCQNLLVAGKTLSCMSQAVGGMRCMPAAMAMGQAAGVASAMAVKDSATVRDINVPLLQKNLVEQGAILD